MPHVAHGADGRHALYLGIHDVVDLQFISNNVDDLSQIDMVELETYVRWSAGFFTDLGLLGRGQGRSG